MSSTKIDALTIENYDTWVIQAEAVLMQHKFWRHFETSLTDLTAGIVNKGNTVAKFFDPTSYFYTLFIPGTKTE